MKLEFKKDLSLINLIALIEVFVITIFSNDILRIVLGFPFLLFCPGYAIVSALFTKKDDLDTIERIALSIGLSVAIVPLVGLILHFTYGIRLYPILFSMAGVVFLFSIVARYRRRRIGETFAFIIEIRWKELPRGEKVYRLILLLLVFLISVVTVQTVTAPKIEKFTEFYILDSEDHAENYPKNLTLGESAEVILGIRNHEAQEEEYRVVIRLEGEIIETIDEIKLKHGKSWGGNINFVPSKAGENMKVEFLLYKSGEEGPYRTLRLFVNISG